MIKKLFSIASLLLVSLPVIMAQSFEFRYHGESLADGATVTIVAEEDEWGFGEMGCYTNPSSDPNNGLVLKLLSGNTTQGEATITIDENTFNPSRILWCMGSNCMIFGSNTTINRPFTVNNGICQVQFDAENIQSEGHLLATLTATIAGETHIVKIKFTNGEQDSDAYDFIVDGIAYRVNGDGTVTVTSGGSYADAVIIPESVTYNGTSYSVTAIGDQAFYNCSGLSAVIIPGSVTSIGSQAFRYCSNLTWVTIPASVTSMGSSVFSGCSRLQSMLLLGTECDYFTSGASSVCNLYLAPSVTSIKGLGISPYQVYCYGAVPAVCDASTFNSYSGTLHVPPQTLAPYFAAEYWGNFNSFNGDAVWVDDVDIALSEESVTMKIGETGQLTASFGQIPTGMTTQWFTTNSNIVEVSGNGMLTAKAVGDADIVVICGANFATCHVTVEDETVVMALDHTSLTLNMDDIATITPSHTPAIVPVEYTFTCSDNEVVMTQWNNGVIRLLATKPGTAVITVSTSDGNSVPATCEVTVKRPFGDVNGDGRLTSVDITCIYNYLLNGDETFAATSDIDGDGYITSVDITVMYNILLNGNPQLNNETEYTVNGVTFKMISVEGGTFTMGATAEQGSDAESNEYPTHQVTLSGFSIGQTEVTQELWQAVMGSNPSYFSGNLQRPVEQVSWNDCQQFIMKLNQMTGKNFRLPTEAEWEYAARGGNLSQGYKYSGSNNIDDVAWYWDNIPSQSSGTSGYGTQTVATKQPNELGIYDMSGNVCELCSDWYGSYSAGAQTNPTGPASGSYRMYRGGGWNNIARGCRVSDRYYYSDHRSSGLGMRLAL